MRLGSPCPIEDGILAFGRRRLQKSRAQQQGAGQQCGKTDRSRPSSTALSVPTCSIAHGPQITRQWVQGRTAITPGTRDAATIASPPPNPSPQAIKRAGSVDDRPMAAWASVRASKYRSSEDNAAPIPPPIGHGGLVLGLLRRIPGPQSGSCGMPASNPPPRSWNMSTVGKALPRRAPYLSPDLPAVGGQGPTTVDRGRRAFLERQALN